ncbi:MAG TPA: type 4a pilus biogenesis protein PilO [Syntrophorhabdaceae bacterium]|jgi:type IV pilus assembly protein PilO
MKMDLGLEALGRKIGNVAATYQLVIVIALNLAIFGVVFFLTIRPQFEEKQKVATQYQEAKRDLDRMIEIKNNMPRYRSEFVKLREQLDGILRQLPETKDIPNLLRSVSAVGTESKVKVTYFEPGTVQNKEFYGEFPFKIRYNGPFHNIGYFFDGIRKADRMIDITDFSLAAKGPANKIVLEGECTAKSYIYTGQPPKGK